MWLKTKLLTIYFCSKIKTQAFKEIQPEIFNFLGDENQNKRVHFDEKISEESVEFLNGELRHREDMIELFQSDLDHIRYQYNLLLNDVRSNAFTIDVTYHLMLTGILSDIFQGRGVEEFA